MQRLKEADRSSNSLIGGRVKGFAGVYDIPTEIRKRTGGGGGGSGGAKGGFSQGFGGTAMGFSSAPVAVAAAAVAATPAAVLAGMQEHGDASRSLTAAALLGSAGSSSSSMSVSSLSGDSFGAVALAGSSRSSVAGTSTGNSSSSAEAWQAAARPAAAAAAAAADALADESLPAAPVRPGKAPEQRLAQDFLLLPTRDSLTYLDGSLPGDLGFDPLGLFEGQSGAAGAAAALDRRWLATSEVIHGRWAMLAVLGCLAPEIAGKGAWWEVPLAFVGVTVGGSSSSSAAAAAAADAGGSGAGLVVASVLLAVLAVAEWCRLQDYKQPGSMAEPLQVLLPQGSSLSGGFAGSGQPAYPGGPLFNFASYVQSGPAMCQFKESEVKHGRLAMLAMLGFVCQAMLTEEGPWENLREHLAAPVQYNLLTEFGTGLGDWDFGESRYGLEEGAGLSPEVAAQHWFDGLAGRPYILAGPTAEEAGGGMRA
jgi:light-harvesting complex I chlorophyll a/b binding protein 3